MSVLLDECVPKSFSKYLIGQDCPHVLDLGWSGKKNGELLQAMREAGYTILLTVDKNLTYQQNLRSAGIAVIVMASQGNRLVDLIPLVPSVLEQIPLMKPGQVVRVTPK